MKEKKPLDPEKIERKLRLASGLFDFAFKAKSFQLRKKYPELSEEEIKRKTYELIEKGCS